MPPEGIGVPPHRDQGHDDLLRGPGLIHRPRAAPRLAGALAALGALSLVLAWGGGARAAAASPALTVTLSPCPQGAGGACAADPTTLKVTWPSTVVVGGVDLSWDGTGRPAAAPAPSSPFVALADGAGTCSQSGDGSTTTCVWPIPAGIEAATTPPQLLDGSYVVTACADDPSTTGDATGASPGGTSPGAGSAAATGGAAAPEAVAPPGAESPPTILPFPTSTSAPTTTVEPRGPTTTPSSTPAPPSTAPPGPATTVATTPTTVPDVAPPAGCDATGLAPASFGVAVIPATPAGLAATGGRTVTLRWDAVPDADLAGYRVARDGVTIWACSLAGAPESSLGCPPSPAMTDTTAVPGTHRYSVVSLRYPAVADDALLTSAPAVTSATVAGAVGVSLPSAPAGGGFHLSGPAGPTPAGAPTRTSGVVAVTAPSATGYQPTLPYGAGPSAVAAAPPAAEAVSHTSVDHAALLAAAALLLAVAAHLAYLNGAIARRVAARAASHLPPAPEDPLRRVG